MGVFPQPRNRITYNELCRKCVHSCKQSFRAEVGVSALSVQARQGGITMMRGKHMSNEKAIQNTTVNTSAMVENAPVLVKKIGRTTYRVKIHFSKTSRETMGEKIKRMLRNEVSQM